jgi:hypothetical protein
MEAAHEAGARLLRLIDRAEARVRFNKGTLQSWLVYAAWAPQQTGPVPDGLLARFEKLRGQARQNPDSFALGRLVALYDDRASYRVTDVSSVLIRDLAIHLVSQKDFHTAPKRGSERLLSALSHDGSGPVQSLVSDYLEQSEWGTPILNGGSPA